MGKIYEIACSSGMGASLENIYNSCSGQSFEEFCNDLEKKDEVVCETLNLLNKYGLHDALLSLNLIVHFSGLKEVSEWFAEKMASLGDNELIQDLFDKFVNKETERVKDCIRAGIFYEDSSLENNLKHSCVEHSAPEISEFVWENYTQSYLSSIGSTSDKLVGIWKAGIYSAAEDERYIDDLEKKVFPYLKIKANSIKSDLNYDREAGLIQYVLFQYIFNIFDHRFSRMGDVVDSLVDEDIEKVADEDCRNFYLLCKEILKRENKFNLNLSESFYNLIMELIGIFECFSEYKSYFKSNTPLVMAFIGNNDYAYFSLINEIKSPDTQAKWKKEYLAALYRCLLVTNDETKRKRLISIFDEAYDNAGAIISLGNWMKAYVEFCDSWTQRLKDGYEERFGKRNLSIFLNDSDRFVSKWVITDALSNRLKYLTRVISKAENGDIQKAIRESIELIYSLTGHLDDEIRIYPSRICKLFSQEDDFNSDELCFMYTKTETYMLRLQMHRFENIKKRILDEYALGLYKRIKNNVDEYWNTSDATILSQKLSLAYRGIQSDPYNIWQHGEGKKNRDEDSLNNLVAFFLKAYYGEECVHRESPQGLSSSELKQGETDIIIYKDKHQFAIQEALKLESLDKSSLGDHLNRLMIKYDTRGVAVKVLTVYGYKKKTKFYKEVINYVQENLKGSAFCDYKFSEPREIVEKETQIGHYEISYIVDSDDKVEKLLIVYIVLMQDV